MDSQHAHLARPSKGFAPCVLAVLIAYVLCFAWCAGDCFVDDAYIDFVYVRNLLAGEGFVFRAAAPPVEGVTNIGWALLLTPLAAIVGPPLAAKSLGLMLLILGLLMTAALGRQLAARASPGSSSALALGPVLVLACSFDFIYFSLAGMETALLACLLLLMARIAWQRPASLILPVLGALAFLVHPEALLVYPLYAVVLQVRGQVPRRRLCWGSLLLAALVAAATLARWAYFGDLVPNTFHAKPSSLVQVRDGAYALLMGRNLNIPFPLTGWLALPLLAFGFIRLHRRVPAAAAMLAATAGTGLAFSAYSLPDWTEMARYFAPYLPAALLLFWFGLCEVIGYLLPRPGQATARHWAACGTVALLMLTAAFDTKAKWAQMDRFPGYVLASKNLVAPALWLRDHLPAEATIATRRIGALGYYSRRAIFDYTFGLPDPEVARLVAAAGHRLNLPSEPALAELWRQRAPEFLLEDAPIMDMIASQTGGTREQFVLHGQSYRVVQSFPIGRDQHWLLARREKGDILLY